MTRVSYKLKGSVIRKQRIKFKGSVFTVESRAPRRNKGFRQRNQAKVALRMMSYSPFTNTSPHWPCYRCIQESNMEGILRENLRNKEGNDSKLHGDGVLMTDQFLWAWKCEHGFGSCLKIGGSLIFQTWHFNDSLMRWCEPKRRRGVNKILRSFLDGVVVWWIHVWSIWH